VRRAVIEDDGVGDYFITLKISDAAGNETMKSAVVTVTFLNSLLPILPFTPPTTAALTPSPLPEGEGESSNFGGTTSEPTGEVTSSPSTTGGGNSESTGEITTTPSSAGGIPAEGTAVSVHSWTKPSQSASFPIPDAGILWGAASAATVGYFLSEAQKRKEEEEQKQAEARRAIDAAHAAEQESLAAMNAELRRQEEEAWREAEERREAREAAAGDSDLYYPDFSGADSSPILVSITTPIGGGKPLYTYALIPLSEISNSLYEKGIKREE